MDFLKNCSIILLLLEVATMFLPSSYDEFFTQIESNDAKARIYVDAQKIYAYKIYRKPIRFSKLKLNAVRCLNHPCFNKPFDKVQISGLGNKTYGYRMKYLEGTPLSNLEDASMEDLIKASLEIMNVVDELSEKAFLVNGSRQDILYDGSFKFVDAYSYTYLKKAVVGVLYKWNIREMNETILSRLLGMSYKRLVGLYLEKTSPQNKKLFDRLNTSNDVYVYEVLDLLQDAAKDDSFANVKSLVLSTKQN
jgi:hypothetical protein